jgi:3-oxoacyl-[acyl-carrier protein] reductase
MKKIVMTGATGGIGSEIKKALLLSNIVVEELNSSDIDLSEEFSINIDNVDGFIHCAGVNKIKKISELEKKEFNRIFDINTYSFLKICNQLKFNYGANILAIGSIYSNNVKEGRIQYSMSKHALYAAVKTMCLEYSDRRIKCNMISPGFVDTKMTRQNNSDERIAELNDYAPLGLVKTEDIANLVLFFIQNNNSITGQNIIIDAGYTCKLF